MKAALNRTITLSEEEREELEKELLLISHKTPLDKLKNRVINQDFFSIVDLLPSSFVDLLFVDPPYNLNKKFGSTSFRKTPINEYASWVESWLSKLIRLLKPEASVYICGDWRSSSAIHMVCEKYLKVKNRITFEREKGRGSTKNWKNNSEDIWYCTVSEKFYFNASAVKLKKKVIAPYRENGLPKGWERTDNGNFRLTFPSNLWTDITIPFWSMPENTPHPTQKPEKLLAKIILASTREGDFVLDPFAGSGTTGVTAKKLNRNFLMIEIDREYALYAIKRLKMAEINKGIQGYSDGIFYERNFFNRQ